MQHGIYYERRVFFSFGEGEVNQPAKRDAEKGYPARKIADTDNPG